MKKNWKPLIQTMRIYSQDTGMEFGKENYAMHIMRSGKQHVTEWKSINLSIYQVSGTSEYGI